MVCVRIAGGLVRLTGTVAGAVSGAVSGVEGWRRGALTVYHRHRWAHELTEDILVAALEDGLPRDDWRVQVGVALDERGEANLRRQREAERRSDRSGEKRREAERSGEQVREEEETRSVRFRKRHGEREGRATLVTRRKPFRRRPPKSCVGWSSQSSGGCFGWFHQRACSLASVATAA